MKEVLGDVCADCGKPPGSDKRRYVKIGIAFKDEQGRISLKIDTLPIPSEPWVGWVNIFPKENHYDAAVKKTREASRPSVDMQDDIPF